MIRIVDRRFDSKNKSSVNRSRFIRRFKSQIRRPSPTPSTRAASATWPRASGSASPAKDIAEPQFSTGPGRRAGAGAARATTGSPPARPSTAPRPAGGGKGSKASPDGEGLGRLRVHPDPGRVPGDLLRGAGPAQPGQAPPGQHQGVQAGAGRLHPDRRAHQHQPGAHHARRRRAPHRRGRPVPAPGCGNWRRNWRAAPGRRRGRPEVKRLAATRSCASGPGSEAVPFIDSFDLRYNNHVRIAQPTTQAVMFCLMDISGSMDEQKKNIAKRFFTLLYLFLTRTYEHIDVVFIRHHTRGRGGGRGELLPLPGDRRHGGLQRPEADAEGHRAALQPTACGTSTAPRPPTATTGWRIRSCCYELLNDQILGLTQFYAYIEIAEDTPQNLWEEYEKVQAAHPGIFAMRRITAVTEIYPVFHDLFKKRVVGGRPWPERRSSPCRAARNGASSPSRPTTQAIGRIAQDYGLDCYPHQLEIISTEQMMDAYASIGMPVYYHHWSFGKQFLATEKPLQARPDGAGLRDRDQLRPLHRLPDGGEHPAHAGAGHRPRRLRPQLLLQGQPPVPPVDQRQRHHRLPGVRPELHRRMRGAPRPGRGGAAAGLLPRAHEPGRGPLQAGAQAVPAEGAGSASGSGRSTCRPR